MFFGTPHRMTYGVVLQELLDITAKHDVSAMKELQKNIDTLARLTLESRHQLSKCEVVSFYETQKTISGPLSFLVERSIQTSTIDLLT